MTTALPVRCTACDDSSSVPEPYFYLWRERRFAIYRCRRCTHQFVHPAVTPEDQALMYSDGYFAREGDWVCGVFGAGYLEAESSLRKEARQILTMLPVSSGRLLDIGCAGGVFLDEASKHGFAVSGIELNSSMAQHARDEYHLEVLSSRIEDVPENEWSAAFDVITMLDCLEHVPEPLAAMRKVHHWLRPNGTAFIRGPLSNSPVGRLKEGVRRLFGLAKQLPGYPLDANMFNKVSLGKLLEVSGFDNPIWIGETSAFSNLVARRRTAPTSLRNSRA